FFRLTYSPSSFKNLGNTCYMNAVLQCLISLKPFIYDLQHDLFFKSTDLSFHRSILSVTEESMQKRGVVDPKGVKQAIGNYAKQFSGFSQQDAHEFFVYSVDQIEDNVTEIIN